MFFPLGLSNFWVGAWFPFDEGQSNMRGFKMTQKNYILIYYYQVYRNQTFVSKNFGRCADTWTIDSECAENTLI